MHTLTINIKDNAFDRVLNLLKSLSTDVEIVSENDHYAQELQKRIDEIDQNKTELKPIKEGMKQLRKKMHSKYADPSN